MAKPVADPMNSIEMDCCLDMSNYDGFLLPKFTAADLAGNTSTTAEETAKHVPGLKSLLRSLSADRKSRYYAIREAHMKWDCAYTFKGLPDLNTRQRSLSADLKSLLRSLSADIYQGQSDRTDNTDPTVADPTDNTDPTAADLADLPAMGEKLLSAAYVLHAEKEFVFWKNSAGARLIKDDDNNEVLKVYPVGWNSHELHDIPGHRLIATLVPQVLTLHGHWKAFSAETSNVLFTMKRPHIIQPRTDLLVSLADGGVDLKIRGSWKNRSCRVYRGGLIIAEMQSPGADMPEEAKFMIKIYPGENYALVVSLFVMMEAKKGSPWTISAEQSSILDHVKTGCQYLGPIGGCTFAVLNSCSG